jgi:hypothetical protein
MNRIRMEKTFRNGFRLLKKDKNIAQKKEIRNQNKFLYGNYKSYKQQCCMLLAKN